MRCFGRANGCLMLVLSIAVVAGAGSVLAAETNPFLGRWALTIPNGGAGWLGVEQNGDALTASILWGGGSVVPVDGVSMDSDTLVLTRLYKTRGATETETIRAQVEGAQLRLSTERSRGDGKVRGKAEFKGVRIPALPGAPNLKQVKFGEPITLFNGRDLSGWEVMNRSVPNGWSVKDGVLVNQAPQEPGKHKSYANLRTVDEFEDFHLALEVRMPERGNSGVYLAGSTKCRWPIRMAVNSIVTTWAVFTVVSSQRLPLRSRPVNGRRWKST